jgi:S1-C subfamily serine protease
MSMVSVLCPACQRTFSVVAVAGPKQSYCLYCGRKPSWFYSRDNTTCGPMPFEHMQQLARTGGLRSVDMVLREGTTLWLAASAVQELWTKPAAAPNAAPSAPAASSTRSSQHRAPEKQLEKAFATVRPVEVSRANPTLPKTSTTPEVLSVEQASHDEIPYLQPVQPPVLPYPTRVRISRNTRVLVSALEKANQRVVWLALGASAVVVVLVLVILALSSRPTDKAYGKTIPSPKAAGVMEAPEIYKRTLRSTAWVLCANSSGSGCLVEGQRRLLLTNYHVVQNSKFVNVHFPIYDRDDKPIGDREFYLKTRPIRGRVLLSDSKSDLAVLELESLAPNTLALPLATESPSTGQLVYSVGNPGSSGALWTLSKGTVRHEVTVNRLKLQNGQLIEAKMIETDSPINFGDSGGPLVNDRCELVGICSSFISQARLQSAFIDATEVRGILARVMQ